ncbi:MAG: hypothetical protein RQ743_12565 [Bacteroidales bacterium]|nr:hypothetical protein [Bacteroidales bacterium]MDT8402520.1 hypothetical protein [Bacteroidales bacterium]
MKTKKVIFLIFACFGLMSGCEQFEMPDDDLTGIDLTKAISQAVFTVEPTGFDDTENLKNAFAEAVDAGPGAVVQLVEGEYFLGFLEIRNFYGTMEGAGKTKTIITAMNNLDMQALWDLNLHGDLVKFVGGDVRLSHFTIQTPPGKISVTGSPKGHIRSLVNFSATNAVYEAGNENRSINVTVDNVSFKGQFIEGGPGYNHGYNCFFGLRTGYDYFSGSDIAREKIDFKITNSEINTFVYGLVLESMKNSKLIVGEKNKGNVFSNLDQSGGVWESRNMEILIEGNTFNVPEYSWGFDLSDYPYYGVLKDEPETETTLCNIQNNVFNLPYAEYGIYIRNQRHYFYPNEKPVAYQIRNNQFNMTDGYPWGIVTQVTKDMVIRNNKFSGYGYQALYLTLLSEGGLVLGNNFSTAEFSSAAIFLNANTSNWTVVGGMIKDRVINLGVNNVITGMNVSTSDKSLGRSISEKMVPMNHLMK